MDYKIIYKKAVTKGGWSKNKPDLTTKWGDFYNLVKKRLQGNEVVLDIGTAEGNHFLRLSSYFKKGIGIDIEKGMIILANKNKKHYKVKNVEFKCMDAEKLKFPANTFDVITNKHSPVNFKEVYRILKPQGLFITQQVHETDKFNLKQVFGRGQAYSVKAGTLLERYKRQAKQKGFKHIKSKISNIPYYFLSKKELIRFLTKAPTIPNFGSENDYKTLESFTKKYKTSKGIKSNTSRFLLEMKK